MLKQLICLILCYSLVQAGDRVLLITHAYNQPEFIKVQHKTFTTLMQDSFEFVVFNDASNERMAQQIQAVCEECGIRCHRVPQEIHDRPYLYRLPGEGYHRPNVRHVNCCQYSLHEIGFDFDGIVGFVDSDMFLIRPLSIVQEMEGYDIMAVGRGGENNGISIGYWWPGLCFMRMNRLPDKKTLNFNCGKINGVGVDTGGYSYYYAQAHPEVKSRDIDEMWSYELFCPDRFAGARKINVNASREEKIAMYVASEFNAREIEFLLQKPDTIQFLLNKSFLHYRAGTNYDRQSKKYNDHKKELIYSFIDDVVTSHNREQHS